MFPKIYVDMDGVLAGLYTYLEKIYCIPYKELTDVEFHEQHVNYRIFRHIPKTQYADILIEKIIKLFGKYYILSSPLKGFEKDCIQDKSFWIHENLSILPESIVFDKDKSKYANNNILIDDYGPNLQKWVSAGGIGIKCKEKSEKHDLQHVCKELDKIYNDIMEIA